jgi:selenocysteine lyase/cysteine desulfurase
MAELRNFVGNVDAFPILSRVDFFNHAGVTALPRAAADALRTYAAQAESTAYLTSGWYGDIERLRALMATMINASKEEVAFVKNTSEGISIVASGIDWQWGDRIVTTGVEYPANVYPWMEVVRSHGCKLVMVPEETDPPRRPPRAAREDPRGRRRPADAAGDDLARGVRQRAAARPGQDRRVLPRARKLLCVDAIQSLGALPVDVRAMNIDFLSADGHKWLLGPEGAGVFYCRKELVERTRPLMVGWMNVIDAQEYGKYDYTLRSDAGRFECGTHNVAGLLSLKASAELLSSLGVGKVAQRIRELTDRLINGLTAKGYGIVSPRDRWQWSGIVSFTSPTGVEHEQIFHTLRREHRTEIALREDGSARRPTSTTPRHRSTGWSSTCRGTEGQKGSRDEGNEGSREAEGALPAFGVPSALSPSLPSPLVLSNPRFRSLLHPHTPQISPA